MRDIIEELQTNVKWQDKAIFDLASKFKAREAKNEATIGDLIEQIEDLQKARKLTNLSIIEIVKANELMISTIQRLNQDVEALSKFVWSKVDMTVRGY